MKALSLSLAILACCSGAALAQSSSFSLPSTTPTPPPISPQVVPPPNPGPGPGFAMPVPGRINVPMLPTDYTNFSLGAFNGISLPPLNAAGAVQKVSEQFPNPDDLKQDGEGILVRSLEGAKFSRPSPGSVKLSQGSILVSVRKPSRLGIISTPQGDISVAAEADVIITYKDGLLRVLNLTGHGERVKVKIHSSNVSARMLTAASSEPGHEPNIANPVALAVKVGHEIVSSDHPLSRSDLRPQDGIGRRRFNFLESNVLAVSEFSLESVLTNSDLLVDLNQKTSGLKERRIMGDLSKMAAVLNYMNGEQGFSSSGK